jgi:hypothetical protein
MFPTFPYAAIIAANSKKRPYVANPPKISTLGNYTKTTPEEFHALLVKRTEISGLFETCDIIANWQGFDNLSDKKKRRFVIETETPEYYSIKNCLKRLFKIK